VSFSRNRPPRLSGAWLSARAALSFPLTLLGASPDVATTLGIPRDKVRVSSPFIGGGFGAKLWLRADAMLAALGARAARRPVRVSMQRALIPNNTLHRSATIQRIRIGATPDGKITAIAHEAWSGNLPKGNPEAASIPTRSLYAGPNRLTSNRLAILDLPEANAMRAPNEAPGMAALEIAIDEMAEKLSRVQVPERTRGASGPSANHAVRKGSRIGASRTSVRAS
jgi:xanthine dehydrogenase YagR molybdenum-binding subunit